MAETYRIYDYHGVPGRLLGTLVAGLGDESRVVRKATGRKASMETVMLARLYDLFAVVYSDGKHNIDSLAEKLIDKPKEEKKKTTNLATFSSGEEFLAAREKLIKEMAKDG